MIIPKQINRILIYGGLVWFCLGLSSYREAVGRIGRAEATPNLILLAGLAVGPVMAVAGLFIPKDSK